MFPIYIYFLVEITLKILSFCCSSPLILIHIFPFPYVVTENNNCFLTLFLFFKLLLGEKHVVVFLEVYDAELWKLCDCPVAANSKHFV